MAPLGRTVAGRTSPFESKQLRHADFLSRMPVTFAISFSVPSMANGYWLGKSMRGRVSDPSIHTTLIYVLSPNALISTSTPAADQASISAFQLSAAYGSRISSQALVRASDSPNCSRALLVHVRRPAAHSTYFSSSAAESDGNLRACTFRGSTISPGRLIENAIVKLFNRCEFFLFNPMHSLYPSGLPGRKISCRTGLRSAPAGVIDPTPHSLRNNLCYRNRRPRVCAPLRDRQTAKPFSIATV